MEHLRRLTFATAALLTVGVTTACADDAPAHTRGSLAGDVTWAVTFDAAAKAAGATDCSYTRRYVGEENTSRPWGCPTCDARFRTAVQIVGPLDACHDQVTGRKPEEEEWLGYGGGPWWRGNGALMSEQGTAKLEGKTLRVSNTVEDIAAPRGGLMRFDISGNLEIGEESGDPLDGFRPVESYACGWHKASPPPYEGDYSLAVGSPIPDGVFRDACDEPVRLHDFAGAYWVISMSAIDCPPCQSMAVLEEQFVADMAAIGITVHVISLLAPGLFDRLGETTTEMLTSWAVSFGLSSPVLADRGWGLSVFQPAIGADTTGYPSWAIVDPNLTVLEFGTGFDSWSSFEAAIRADSGL